MCIRYRIVAVIVKPNIKNVFTSIYLTFILWKFINNIEIALHLRKKTQECVNILCQT